MSALARAGRILAESAACLSSWRPRKRHRLAVLALFKNEAHALAEWVEHYAGEGATAIHLVNNNSDDDYRRVLTPHLRSGLVVLHDDDRLHAQRRIYNEHLQRLRHQCDWLLVCDLDEFLYARGGHANTLAYLNSRGELRAGALEDVRLRRPPAPPRQRPAARVPASGQRRQSPPLHARRRAHRRQADGPRLTHPQPGCAQLQPALGTAHPAGWQPGRTGQLPADQ
ncbi:MAG: glycosyltransferase family 2 protein [Vulcanococcus sp.]